MTTTTIQLSDKQKSLQREFEQIVKAHPQQIAQSYLRQYGPIFSTRLACELSQTYRQSDKARGYYRPALEHAAILILKHGWQSSLAAPASNKPILIIAGGGPGSGKLTAINNPLLAFKKEILCAYDVANQTHKEVQTLLAEAHAANIPTIFAYILRPLPQAARASILRNLKEAVIPDPKLFAISHLRNYNTFLAITQQYAKTKKLFAAIVIDNVGTTDFIQTTKPPYLKQFSFTLPEAEDVYNAVLREMSPDSTTEFFTPKHYSIKPPRKPRTAKTLAGQSTYIGYLLGQNLRSNLISQEQNKTRTIPSPSFKASADGPEPPTQTLIHTKIPDPKTQTLTDQERTLENERPLRTVVRETITHIQEMETVKIR